MKKNGHKLTTLEISKIPISRIGLPLPYYGYIAYVFYLVFFVYLSKTYGGNEFNNAILTVLAIVIFFSIRYVVLLDAYPKKLGDIETTVNEIFFPACLVSSKEAEVVKYEQIKETIIYYNFNKGKLGAPLYIEIMLNTEDVIGLSCIVIDINRMKTLLEKNVCNNIKIIQLNMKLYFALLIGAFSILIILLTAIYR